jgi:hypothetical protein
MPSRLPLSLLLLSFSYPEKMMRKMQCRRLITTVARRLLLQVLSAKSGFGCPRLMSWAPPIGLVSRPIGVSKTRDKEAQALTGLGFFYSILRQNVLVCTH